MVKTVDIEEQTDAGRDDECYEIDPAEFAKKVHLKETDDAILVAAKGKIKVEVDQPEDFAKTLDVYGSESDCLCICISGDADGNRHEFAAGDCKVNPCKIDEDETSLLLEIDEDRFVIDKLSAKFEPDEHNDGQFFHGDTVDVVPGKRVVECEPIDINGVEVIPDKPVVECEAVDDNDVQAAQEDGVFDEEDAPERRIFDEEDDEDVVVV